MFVYRRIRIPRADVIQCVQSHVDTAAQPALATMLHGVLVDCTFLFDDRSVNNQSRSEGMRRAYSEGRRLPTRKTAD